MVVKVLVVLVALALVARRLLPRRRLPWAVPLVLGGSILVVRSVAYLLGNG